MKTKARKQPARVAKTRKSKPSTKMTSTELEAAAAIYEQEFADESFEKLSPASQRRWERVKRKMGRPKVGDGVKVVSISLESGLLDQADKLAKKMGISRARLVSRGLNRLVEEAAANPAAAKSSG